MEGIGPQQHHPVRNQNAAGSGDANQSAPQQPHSQPTQSAAAESSRKKWYYPTLESKIVVIILMLAALVVLTTFIAGLFHQKVTVSDFVRSDQHQAVFLNNGQVYFGHITGTNGDTLILEDIYYLQVDQQLQPEEEGAAEDPQVSLAKLGDEMHGPEDQMFINRDQITFWENLREDGQVSQAISQFEQQGEGGNIDPEAAEDELPGDVDPQEQTGQDPSEQDDPDSAEDDSTDSE